MMQAEEVQYVLMESSCDPCLYKYLCVTSRAELVVKNLQRIINDSNAPIYFPEFSSFGPLFVCQEAARRSLS